MRKVLVRPVETLDFGQALKLWYEGDAKVLAAVCDGRVFIAAGPNRWVTLANDVANDDAGAQKATDMYLFDDEYEFAAWLLTRKPLHKETE